jgi:HEAT repeat protein
MTQRNSKRLLQRQSQASGFKLVKIAVKDGRRINPKLLISIFLSEPEKIESKVDYFVNRTKLGCQDALKMLLICVDEKFNSNAFARAGVIKGFCELAKMGKGEVVNGLIKAMGDSNIHNRVAALDGLDILTKKGFTSTENGYLKGFQDDNVFIKRRALDGLLGVTELGSRRTINGFKYVFNDPKLKQERWIAAGALEMLAKEGRQETLSGLIWGLKDDDYRTVESSIKGLKHLAKKGNTIAIRTLANYYKEKIKSKLKKRRN